MKISSFAFENESQVPVKYTCDGKNISPPLSFSEVPATAKSLGLIMDDPDAPNGTFVHWVLFNIKPNAKGINENSVPDGAIQGRNGIGKASYAGACPPSGIHHYYFKLYALDTVLNVENPDKAAIEEKMKGHILEEAQLIGIYSRK